MKWLHRITLSDEESTCHWQQKDYKGFHASIDWHNVDFSTVPAIHEYPVQSAITEPADGAELDDDEEVTVKGRFLTAATMLYRGGGDFSLAH